MTTPIEYAAMSTVMATTANGGVVPSAYGDQVRDNLMAVATGWSFTATRAVSAVVPSSAWTLINVQTFDTPYETGLTTTSLDKMVSLVGGYMTVGRPGMWLFSGSIVASGTVLFATSISVGTAIGLANSASDIHQEGYTGVVVAPFKVVTVPTYVGLWGYNGGGPGLSLSSTVAPKLEGVWMGDA